jgi:hypothetical protein
MRTVKMAAKLARETTQGIVEALPFEPRLVDGVQEEIAFGCAIVPDGKRCYVVGVERGIKPVISNVLDGCKECRLALRGEAPPLIAEHFSLAGGCLGKDDNVAFREELGPAQSAAHPGAPVSACKEEGLLFLADRGEIAVQIDKIHGGVQLPRVLREVSVSSVEITARYDCWHGAECVAGRSVIAAPGESSVILADVILIRVVGPQYLAVPSRSELGERDVRRRGTLCARSPQHSYESMLLRASARTVDWLTRSPVVVQVPGSLGWTCDTCRLPDGAREWPRSRRRLADAMRRNAVDRGIGRQAIGQGTELVALSPGGQRGVSSPSLSPRVSD